MKTTNHRPGSRIGFLLAAAGLVALSVAAPPASAQPTTVRYTEVLRSVLYLPAYIADKNGYFAEEGLQVNFTTGWGTDKVMPQLMTGSADIVLLGPESQIFVENSPSPDKTKIFCKVTAKDGQLVMSRQKPPATGFQWSSMKGKDFLDWRVGTTPQVTTEWVLKKHGIDVKKDLGNYMTNIASANRDASWLGGRGDFGTFFEPTASRLERDGQAHVVASIGEEIGPFAYTVFMATDRYIAANPKVIQGWCNAIQKGLSFVARSDPSDLAKLATSYFPQLDLGLLLSSIKRYRDLKVWPRDVSTEPSDIEKLQDILVAGGVLKKEQRITFEKAVTRTFSDRARKLAN